MAAERMPELPYTVKQVANMYGCSTETIRREINSGRLRASHKRGQTKVWYITKDALKDWVENMLEEV